MRLKRVDFSRKYEMLLTVQTSFFLQFRRPLQTNEPINDRPIPSEGEISIIAAIGPLNSRMEANAHDFRDRTLGKLFLKQMYTLTV